jgi:hypothetical protein
VRGQHSTSDLVSSSSSSRAIYKAGARGSRPQAAAAQQQLSSSAAVAWLPQQRRSRRAAQRVYQIYLQQPIKKLCSGWLMLFCTRGCLPWLLVLTAAVAASASASAYAATTTTPASDKQQRQPHILFALVDDLGHFNVQLTNPKIKTPCLTELRKQGIFLNRHYTYKYCSPSRNSLMSGRLPIHIKEDNGWVGGVPQNMTVIAAKLKSAGYATAQIGKVSLFPFLVFLHART